MYRASGLVMALWTILAAAWSVSAQTTDSPRPAATTQPATQPATTQPAVSAEHVQQQMQQLMSANPQLEPPQVQTVEPAPIDAPPIPSITGLDVDMNVLGIPPGGPQPKLRREGEFIINRRGHLTRSPSGGQILFVFEADSDSAPEPPMPLLPCQILENMESLSSQKNDQTVFIVSGQVMLYRGVNFLLPTMMKLSIDRGNLQN